LRQVMYCGNEKPLCEGLAIVELMA